MQVAYYTDKITHHEGWQLAGIFADDGISGVSTKKREQFNKMIELCRKKKIDLILTKSISRFARNTLDCIKHVRILKSWGIPVIFEKENIDTSNMNSEIPYGTRQTAISMQICRKGQRTCLSLNGKKSTPLSAGREQRNIPS